MKVFSKSYALCLLITFVIDYLIYWTVEMFTETKFPIFLIVAMPVNHALVVIFNRCTEKYHGGHSRKN